METRAGLNVGHAAERPRQLALYLRVMAPWEPGLDAPGHGLYAAAADQLDAGSGSDVAVAGCRFRVVRVERLIRIGPDGPEGLRPSDPDPEPPVMVQEQQMRDQGLRASEDEDTQRLARLFRQDEQRRQARPGNQPPPGSA